MDERSVIRRHPVRGALWGLVFGLGAALLLISQKVIAFGTLPPLLVVLGGIVLGVLSGTVLPPRGERGRQTGSDAGQAPQDRGVPVQSTPSPTGQETPVPPRPQ